VCDRHLKTMSQLAQNSTSKKLGNEEVLQSVTKIYREMIRLPQETQLEATFDAHIHPSSSKLLKTPWSFQDAVRESECMCSFDATKRRTSFTVISPTSDPYCSTRITLGLYAAQSSHQQKGHLRRGLLRTPSF